MGEFDLIQRYFHRPSRKAVLGNGDDCALIAPTTGQVLAVSTDMLLEGRHFFANVPPAALGYKALAVNLSDLAAMGAEPVAFTLALALPRVDEQWLAEFARGLLALADEHDCELIGGDTTAGPLNICITVLGQMFAQQALRRSAAQAGDEIWVSGTLGGAALAVELEYEQLAEKNPQVPKMPRALKNTPHVASLAAVLNSAREILSVDDIKNCQQRLQYPTPRIALGMALRGVAHSAIDLSDGLAGDLQHICKASKLNAKIDVERLPTHAALEKLPFDARLHLALNGGDDYELCFSAPTTAHAQIQALSTQLNLPLTHVGVFEKSLDENYSVVFHRKNAAFNFQASAFDHFQSQHAK